MSRTALTTVQIPETTPLTSMEERRRRASLPYHQRLKDFLQTVSTCDAMVQQENAALRSQVYDLTELLAAFDLCEIEDEHLNGVRDRAFRRDIAVDAELLQVYRVERQLQQEALLDELSGSVSENSEHLERTSRVVQRDVDSIQLRVEVLEREVANLRLRHDLLLETTTSKLKCPAVDVEACQDGNAEYPSASGDNDTVELNTQHQEEVKPQKAIYSDETEAIKEKRTVELENALAVELARSAELKQQNQRYQEVESILQAFAKQ